MWPRGQVEVQSQTQRRVTVATCTTLPHLTLTLVLTQREKSLTCDICGKAFKFQSALKKGTREVTQARGRICVKCVAKVLHTKAP